MSDSLAELTAICCTSLQVRHCIVCGRIDRAITFRDFVRLLTGPRFPVRHLSAQQLLNDLCLVHIRQPFVSTVVMPRQCLMVQPQ